MHTKISYSLFVSLAVFVGLSFGSYVHAELRPQLPISDMGQGMPPRQGSGQGTEMNRPGMMPPPQGRMQGSTSIQVQGQDHGQGQMPAGGRMMPGPGMNDGSTSPRMRAGIPPMASSTRMNGDMQGDMHGDMRMKGIPGKVTDIESSYISMVGRNMSGATTTFTVNLSASTTYSNGSSTASFSDVTVGSMIAVDGPFSTTTNTISARHIFVNIPKPPTREMRNDDQNNKGFFGSIGSFFGNMFGGKQPNNPPSDQDTNSANVSTGASAVADTTFFDRVLSSLGHLF